MADERYEWLDKDAAEKLLRGEPAASLDGHPGTEAEELAAALAAVARTARPATGELPGEAQALVAFRAAMQPARAVRPGQSERPVRSVEPAQAERPVQSVQSASSASSASSEGVGDAASAGAAGGPEQDDALAPVRIRPVGGVAGAGAAPGPRRPRSPRWGRPLRFGLVASFAGCALGGVAVATGAGMLPGPFGRDAPEPAISVSADASPDGSGSQGVSGTTPSAEPPASPDATSSGPRGGSSAPDDDRGAGDGPDRKGDGRKGGTDQSSPAVPGSGASGLWYAQALKACRDYRAGDLDADRRRALEALARGPHNLERYCDRLIGQSAGNGNKGKNGKNGKNGKGGNGQGNENGDHDDQDDQGGKGQNGPGGTVGNNGRDGDEANAFGDGRGPASPVNRFTTGPNPKRPPATPPRGPRAATAVLPPAVSYALGSALPSADRSVTVPVFPAAGRAAGAGTGSPGADDRRGQGRGTAVPHRV